MVNKLSVVAEVVTALIQPKILESVGEKIGEIASVKSEETIKILRQNVQEKLQAAGTSIYKDKGGN
jgi:hypothetical protein